MINTVLLLLSIDEIFYQTVVRGGRTISSSLSLDSELTKENRSVTKDKQY